MIHVTLKEEDSSVITILQNDKKSKKLKTCIPVPTSRGRLYEGMTFESAEGNGITIFDYKDGIGI
jgi:hypothetical protein